MKKMKLALLGTQAAGKGSQTFILSVTMGVPGVSVGNLLREISKEDTERGRTVKSFLDKGGFPPEEIVLPVLKDWIEKHPGGWVVDGFPRTMSQAKMSAGFFKPDAAIFLEVPDEEARRRILYRRICSKCKTNYNIITQPPKNSKGVCDICGGELVKRGDDTAELVNDRLKQYHELTAPVKGWFRDRGMLIEIDGRPGMKEVAHEIEVRLGSYRKRFLRLQRWQVWTIGLMLAAAAFMAGLVWIGANA